MKKSSVQSFAYAKQQKLVTQLLACFRQQLRAGRVKLVETHISWIILAGSHAYKIKKPVNLEFLDFTTLAARKYYCEEEIRLNRRLAQGLYIGVVPIGGSVQRPRPGRRPAIEYAVKLRRFPQSHQLDLMAERGQLKPQHIDQLAGRLAGFHQTLPGIAQRQPWGSAASLLAAVEQNFTQLHAMLAGQAQHAMLKTLHETSLEEYRRCADRVDRRKRQGFVRECHGDLHLGNIVLLDNAPVPFDAIEFNAAFRYIDLIDEVSFTMMDLLYHQLPALAWRFLDVYLACTGDYAGLQLLRLYLSFRAMVRAKVAAIRSVEPGMSKPAEALALRDCRQHLQLAESTLRRSKPVLIVTHGLPGTGKSTFASMALEKFGAIRLRSDVERKRLAGLGMLQDSLKATGQNLYAPDYSRMTYERLRQLAGMLLQEGFVVIVDAAFLKRDERMRFHELAQSWHAVFVIASISTDAAILRERLLQRQAARNDASEADVEVLDKLLDTAEPLDASEQDAVIHFENGVGGFAACADAWDMLSRRVTTGK